MFNLKTGFTTNFLNMILNIAFVIGISAAVFTPFCLGFIFSTVKSVIFGEINCILYLLIILELKNIIRTVIKEKPFVLSNVLCFRKIGIYVFTVGLFDMINNIISNKFRVLFAFNQDGFIKNDIFLFMILGCTALVIANVFEKAIKIKAENDMTI